MTVGEWLAERWTDAPERLVAEVRTALGDDLDAPASEVPERCLAAAERITAGLLATGRTGRESALPLLAADALVTYAFEAAAEDPLLLEQRAAAALRALATLG